MCFQCTISMHGSYELQMNEFCTISITKSSDAKFMMYSSIMTIQKSQIMIWLKLTKTNMILSS
jgi:hypothetical protein